jgi:hypothetical protein
LVADQLLIALEFFTVAAAGAVVTCNVSCMYSALLYLAVAVPGLLFI